MPGRAGCKVMKLCISGVIWGESKALELTIQRENLEIWRRLTNGLPVK